MPGIEVGHPTVGPGDQTALGTEAGGPTARPSGQSNHGTEAGGLTAIQCGQTARPCVTSSSPASMSCEGQYSRQP
jgi:hypothetical protein